MRIIILLLALQTILNGQSILDFPSSWIRIWPEFAPGETAESSEKRMNDRGVEDIFHPTLTLYGPAKGTASGAAVVFLPDGGFTWPEQAVRWLRIRGLGK